jgi:hypothetical protein
MERSNFSLRLLPSLLKAAQRIAERENCSVNQLVNVALAEKIAVLDQGYWDERKRKAISHPPSKAWKKLPGKEPPREGDEIPESFRASRSARGKTLRAGGR